MKVLSSLISVIARMRHAAVRNWTIFPLSAQRNVLQHLITQAQYTEFGKKFNFSRLFTVRDFKKKVPIHEYDDIKPYIVRMMEGEENVLWNTPIYWFAKSSGTTSDKSKFIPISEESLKEMHFKASKDVLTNYYKNFPDSELLTGKSLVVGGSHQLSTLHEEIQYGDLSAVLMQNTPFWGHWIRTPDLRIALLDEWESKIDQIAGNTINENVTSIAGVPTWTIILIKKILEITGKKTLKEVWPNLELYLHGGVSFVPYREQFQKLIGAPINYLETYNASEGFFAAQNTPQDDSLLLFTDHGIFYEFMPVDEYKKPVPKTVGLKEVVLHKNYALVISTNGGLWRYLVGDTIEFTSTKPFKIKVTGRLKHFINAFGEELIVDNADHAMAAASAKMGLVVNDYTAAPVYFSEHKNGAHEWLIEFETSPPGIVEFARNLDAELKKNNSDYEAKRYKDIALGMPIVHILKKGVFNMWLKKRGKLGGQHKVPRLSNNRQMLEEIIALNNE
ncbi:MAG: GH3 auxin-responsive promoter family protein [Ginsengibacter sp.]